MCELPHMIKPIPLTVHLSPMYEPYSACLGSSPRTYDLCLLQLCNKVMAFSNIVFTIIALYISYKSYELRTVLNFISVLI